MKILCMGSVNIDKTYRVRHIPQAGETISSYDFEWHWGGKGLNQAVALARSFDEVFFAGIANGKDASLRDFLRQNRVHDDYLQLSETETGHAIISVDDAGQNCILLYGGANQTFTHAHIDEVLSAFAPGDLLLLQNEINCLDYIFRSAHERGLRIAFNPSPFEPALLKLPLEYVDIFFVNEVEGFQITGKREPAAILDSVTDMFPNAGIVLTLGGDGSVFRRAGVTHRQPIYPVSVVDTTAAGDTFTGYFLASAARGEAPAASMRLASAAASLAVSHRGATDSIPAFPEVEEFLQTAGA